MPHQPTPRPSALAALDAAAPKIKPRIIIHGGAGNIQPSSLAPEDYKLYREALLTIVSKTSTFMTTPQSFPSPYFPSPSLTPPSSSSASFAVSSSGPPSLPSAPSPSSAASVPPPPLPTALDTATFAVLLLENNPLFNAGHGAVFTRDGVNELEASVMVSRGRAKRAVGATGLRRVRNPILLAREMLLRGDADLLQPRPASLGHAAGAGTGGGNEVASAAVAVGGAELAAAAANACGDEENMDAERDAAGGGLDVPSAQGHTLLHGATAEALARGYGLEMVDPAYFFTQRRWDEHVRGLEREGKSDGYTSGGTASWSPDEFMPQGTVGAVALDAAGVVCCATSTGGMTNKLTGRIGDTPVVGAGFWAEEWTERGRGAALIGTQQGPAVTLAESLRGLLADCLPTPFAYAPVPPTAGEAYGPPPQYCHRQGLPCCRDRKPPLSAESVSLATAATTTTRSLAVSGTGNGDSFFRVAAARTVGAMARFAGLSAAEAVRRVAGPGGELQASAGSRWKRTGEGEGGMIGIECVVVRRGSGGGQETDGELLEVRGEVVQDFNCNGMFRAWIDEKDKAQVRIWHD